MEIPKSFEPKECEEKIYSEWEKSGLFECNPDSDKEPFTIVIPPPNVTGVLHVGHAMFVTLQDILTRWKRMKGFDTLWLPGTDHAGIATQMVVSKELQKEGVSKKDIGREKFLEYVWKWKKEKGDTILLQLRKLGASCDWSRTKFTLDDDLSRAVRFAFCSLYKEGLIYKGEYLINWCVSCETAISDLEVEYAETSGKLYYIRYKGEDNSYGIVVATTRPETLLGDTAVAVNPEDERYKKLIGKNVILPILGRKIPIIADSMVDKEFGTGAVKITPAHDPNDFEAGKRHNLPIIKVMNEKGEMTEEAGLYNGLQRFECRKRLLSDLEKEGLLIKVEPYKNSVGHCQRCKTVLESMVSKQWFLKIESLAKPAIAVVEKGEIEIIPEHWKKVYLNWMSEIHDWCISRQLWWGHRIPAFSCSSCRKSAGENDPEKKLVSMDDIKLCPYCGGELTQEKDVLDTWFSSQLWPFSTLGWPDDTKELKRYYPTSVMETGYDILFFWVARMIMAGLKFTGKIPFQKVFLHGLVRDAHGKKMSKTAGNVLDPLDLINKYGADAVRFTLSILCVPGTDVNLDPKRMEGYKAFANKLWNASRFVLLQIDKKPEQPNFSNLSLWDKWILREVEKTAKNINNSLQNFKFYEASDSIYHFVWHSYCDWYLEAAKTTLIGNSSEERKNCVKWVLLKVLKDSLKLLHPFMPFVTEELWQKIKDDDEPFLIVSNYPEGDEVFSDSVEKKIEEICEIVSSIRNIRTEKKVPPSKQIDVSIEAFSEEAKFLIEENLNEIKTLARISNFSFATEQLNGEIYLTALTKVAKIYVLNLETKIDKEKEREKLFSELKKITDEKQKFKNKLNNQNFIERAPKEVIEKHKEILLTFEKKELELKELLQKLQH